MGWGRRPQAAADPGISGQKKMMKKGLRGRGKCVFSKPPIFRFFFLQRAAWALAPPPPPSNLYLSTHGGSDREAGRKGGRVQFFKERSRRRRRRRRRLYSCSGKEEEVFLKSAPLSSLSASFFGEDRGPRELSMMFYTRTQNCPKNVQHPIPTSRIN